MPWTPPRTWTVGEAVSAASLNTDLRDNENYLNTAKGARAYITAALGVVDSTNTIPDLTTTQFDTDGFHSNVTNPSRMTVPTGLGGLYTITAQVDWASNSTGRRVLWILYNGAVLAEETKTAINGTDTLQQVTTITQLAQTDYVQIQLWQNSATTLNATNGNVKTYLALARHGA
ncbi:MAG: hypothetical protein ACYDCC_04870 [Actinomycetota bacterium]